MIVIDLLRALREPEYRKEISHELEGDITEMVMFDAADEIETLRLALSFYANEENWLRDRPLDVNSGNFTGGPAKAALATPDAVDPEET